MNHFIGINKMKQLAYTVFLLLFLYHCRSGMQERSREDEDENAKEEIDPLNSQNKGQGADRALGGPDGSATAKAGDDLQRAKNNSPAEWSRFDFQQAKSFVKDLRLWSTYYYTPVIFSSPGKSYLVRGLNETSVLQNEKLSLGEWCALSLQGSSVIVSSLGIRRTLSFAGRSDKNTTDCSGQIKSQEIVKKIAGNRFRISKAIYGTAARAEEVIPFRTIAVDPKHIPYGSIVYIPAARGAKFKDGNQ